MLEALETGVSMYPRLDGRFPCVSGISFEFAPSRPPQHRIVPETVMVAGEPLELTKVYKVATKEYMGTGKDGSVTCVSPSLVATNRRSQRAVSPCVWELQTLVVFVAPSDCDVGRCRYNVFTQCPMLLDAESGPRVRTVLRNIFVEIKTINGMLSPKDVAVRKYVTGMVSDKHPLGGGGQRNVCGRNVSSGGLQHGAAVDACLVCG